jgi:hypothetical protein
MKSLLIVLGILAGVAGGVLLAVGVAQELGLALLVVGLVATFFTVGVRAGAASGG